MRCEYQESFSDNHQSDRRVLEISVVCFAKCTVHLAIYHLKPSFEQQEHERELAPKLGRISFEHAK